MTYNVLSGTLNSTISTGPVTVVLVADGSMWLVHQLRNSVVQLQSGCVEPVECQLWCFSFLLSSSAMLEHDIPTVTRW